MTKLRFALLLILFGAAVPPSTGEKDGIAALVGRSTRGTWEGMEYELFYYIRVIYATGPSQKTECVWSSAEAAFVNATDETPAITVRQLQAIERAHAAFAADDDAGNPPPEELPPTAQARSRKPMTVGTNKGGAERTGTMARHIGSRQRPSFNQHDTVGEEEIESEENQEEQVFFEEWEEENQMGGMAVDDESIREEFHDFLSSSSGGRYGMVYRMESDAALFLDGEYVLKFKDVTNHDAESLREFVVQKLGELVATSSSPNQRPFGLPPGLPEEEWEDFPPMPEEFLEHFQDKPLSFFSLADQVWLCVNSLEEGDFSKDQSANDTVIVGRSLTGQWEGQAYEILSFIEVLSLVGTESQEQDECYHSSLDKVFVDPYLEATPDTTISVMRLNLEHQNRARRVAMQEEAFRASLNNTQIQADDSSIFFGVSNDLGTFSGGGLYLSQQRGAALFVDGDYVRKAPEGMEDVVAEALESTLVSNITSLLPGGSSLLEISRLEMEFMNDRGRSPYIFLLPELLQECMDKLPVKEGQSTSLFAESGDAGSEVAEARINEPEPVEADAPVHTDKDSVVESEAVNSKGCSWSTGAAVLTALLAPVAWLV